MVTQISAFLIASLFVLNVSAQDEESTCGDRMRRLREFYCVSNCIGLSSPEKTASAMLSGRTKAVNVGFNCSAQEFSGPKVGVCCQSFPNLLLSEASVRTDCVKKNTMKSQDLEMAHNEYIFNKWQGDANTIELEKAAKVNNLDKIIQYMECLFLAEVSVAKFKLMSPEGKIDGDKTDAAFKAALPATAPKPYTELFTRIIPNCTSSVQLTFPVSSIQVNNKTVQAAPFLITQCLRKWIIMECPSASSTVSKACQDTRTNVKNCDFYM
ncbi:uncharacterized protein LOC132195713 isoform X2 [Neocloeon triangulifer]|uniref:uncharacterized protein LOC132195713 isoform X2 n=1 Tax=Neocloeon triangulifer TaxID=2078957 RepID=UPI00286F023F|nr:uncharacterized protein LOC132195713 isoform X2 [Neocloeon triangulifer]